MLKVHVPLTGKAHHTVRHHALQDSQNDAAKPVLVLRRGFSIELGTDLVGLGWAWGGRGWIWDGSRGDKKCGMG